MTSSPSPSNYSPHAITPTASRRSILIKTKIIPTLFLGHARLYILGDFLPSPASRHRRRRPESERDGRAFPLLMQKVDGIPNRDAAMYGHPQKQHLLLLGREVTNGRGILDSRCRSRSDNDTIRNSNRTTRRLMEVLNDVSAWRNAPREELSSRYFARPSPSVLPHIDFRLCFWMNHSMAIS